jgi:hypothetical protein
MQYTEDNEKTNKNTKWNKFIIKTDVNLDDREHMGMRAKKSNTIYFMLILFF